MKKFQTMFACCMTAAFLCACTSRSYIPASTGTEAVETQMQTVEIQVQTEETRVQIVETQPMEMPAQPAEAQSQQQGESVHPDNPGNDTPLPNEADNLEAAQAALAEVLSGQRAFFCYGYEKNQTIDEYCSTFGEESGITAETIKYTTIDMDQDDVPEFVLWITVNGYSDYGTVVLRYQNGGVVGYDFTYRQMIELKKDGTFGYLGGIADTGYARLVFTDDGWKYEEICNVTEDGDTVTFFCNGEVVSREAYWQCVEEQNAKEMVEWIDCA